MLTADVPVLLVIDGFEHVTAPNLDVALLDLLRYTPRLRIVVCLRNFRHFRTSQFLDLDATVLDAPDLRFTEDETRTLLDDTGVALPPDEVQRIVDASGGWPEPTRALALRLRESPDLAADLPAAVRQIAAEYLHERFLDVCPAPLVWLALATSLARSFTPEVAELLTGDSSAESHLDTLGSEGLLTAETRDGEVVYSWPAATRQALVDELRRRWPERIRELHDRLAHWHFDMGQTRQALGHAVRAANWQLSITIVESSWRDLASEDKQDLYRVLAAIPVKVLLGSPRALAVRDMTMRIPDNLFLAAATLPESTADLKAHGRSKDAAEVLDTCLLVLRARRLRGEFDRAATYASRALVIAESARAARSDEVSGLYPALQLQVGITRLLGGDIDAAIPTLLLAAERGADSPMDDIESDAAGKLALAYAMAGEHVQATTWIHRYESAAPRGHSRLNPHIKSTATAARLLTAVDQLELDLATVAQGQLAIHTQRDEFWPHIVYAQAQYALTVGAPADALTVIDRARAARPHQLNSGGVARPLLVAAEANLLLALGRGNLARAVMAGPDHNHPLVVVVRARLALLAGQDEAALRMTQDSSWDRIASGRDRLAMLLIRAIAAARTGDVGSAQAALRRAVDVAGVSGVLRPFATVDRDELMDVAATVPHARRLLDKDPLAQQPDLFPTYVELIELSPREQQVLDQLSEGLTVPQIADSAVLSYNTVRTQQRSLYKKLGTSDRSEAIARARQWGLLQPDPRSTADGE